MCWEFILYSDKLGIVMSETIYEKVWMCIVPVKLHYFAFDDSPFFNMDVLPLVFCDFLQVLKALKTVVGVRAASLCTNWQEPNTHGVL
jgi:hypothetical protein